MDLRFSFRNELCTIGFDGLPGLQELTISGSIAKLEQTASKSKGSTGSQCTQLRPKSEEKNFFLSFFEADTDNVGLLMPTS
mmetsp:Transcript_28842/g.44074  ORF Transcript_28842/g.44074 Transcript_28842/m.44074 type:complete len:81 (+) Transcript_28842:102-344(+)